MRAATKIPAKNEKIMIHRPGVWRHTDFSLQVLFPIHRDTKLTDLLR